VRIPSLVRLAVLAVLVATALTACAGAPAAQSSGSASVGDVGCGPITPAKTLTVGMFPSLGLGTSVVAKAKGYYAAEGLDVQVQQITNDSDSIALLATGKLDAVITGMNANILNAIDTGFDVHPVAAQGTGRPGDVPSGFYVSSKLIDSGAVKTPADLRGRRIGIPGALGHAASYLVGLFLQQGGLALKDVQWVNINQADMSQAFASGAVDAGFIATPFNAIVDQDGTGKRFGDQDLLANRTQAAIFMGPNLLGDPKVAASFLRANMRATTDLQGDYRTKPDVESAFVAAGFKPETIKAIPAYQYDPGLPLSDSTLTGMQQMFADAGVLQGGKVIPFADLTRENLRQAAVQSMAACAR
jgi:NitT/TauT family transport system substrate-binding protein